MSTTSGGASVGNDGGSGQGAAGVASGPSIQLTIYLDSTEPPAGTLAGDRDADAVTFAGWVSLIGAIKTVAAGSSVLPAGQVDDDTPVQEELQ